MADQAHSTRMDCRCGLPLRRPPPRRLPADSWLPGHSPVQEARRASLGKNAVTSVPIPEITAAADSWPVPGGGGEQVPPALKGRHHRLDPCVQRGDHRLQVAGVVQVQAAHQRVMLAGPAFQRHGQVRDLGAHLALGQPGQDRAAAFPAGERLDHRPPGLGRDGGGDGIELDPGVLQHGAQPGDLADPLLRHLRAVADDVLPPQGESQ
jgi:hypothetical protein